MFDENDATKTAAAGRSGGLLFAAATLLYWMTLYIYVPILSPYLEDRGLSLGWIGFILGSYGLTQLAVRLPLGLYSDRLRRRKPFMLAGMLAGMLACLFFMLGSSWQWPLAARLMSGVCASTWVAFTVLYASYYPPQEATKAMGNISFLTVAGQLIGMSASGWLVSLGGWNAAFIAGIAIAAAGLILVLFVKETPPARAGKARTAARSTDGASGWRDVLRHRTLWEVSVLSLLGHGVLFITMFGFTPLQAVELGASEAQLTWLVFAFMIPHAAFSLLTGRVLEPRFGARPIIIAGFALSAVFTALIPTAADLLWLSVTQAFNGAAQALYLTLLLGLAIRDIPTGLRATAMGFYQAVYSLGMFSGPFIAGWLNDAGGLRAGFWFGAALGLAGGVVAAVRAWRTRREAAR